MAAAAIVTLFSGLSAASYGANDSFSGLIASLSAYRFLLGIGVSKILLSYLLVVTSLISGRLEPSILVEVCALVPST
jgi:hypothetical protein